MDKNIYKSVFDHSPMGYACHRIILDKDGVPCDYEFLEVNPAYEKMTGMKASYLVGKRVSGVISIDEEAFNRIRAFGDIALNGGSIEFDQYSEYLKHWFHVNAYSPEKNYFIICCSEITEKKKFYRELQKKESELEAFFDVSMDLLCIFDLRGNLIKQNESWFEVLGYSKNDLKNTITYPELLHPDDLKASLHLLDEIKEKGRISNFRNRCKAKDGHYRWFEWQANVHGNFIYATAHDITKRILSENHLRESKDKFQSLFEQAADGVLIGNQSGIITDANKSMCIISGYSIDELIESNISMLFPESEMDEKPLDYASVLKGDIVLAQRKLLKKDGGIVIVEMNTKKVGDGRLQAYIRDVTEQYLLKEKLRHSEKMEAIGQLAGGVAHDFNNMLAGIIGGASLLDQYVESEKGKKYLKLINDSAQRTSDLTNKLLAFGRKADIEFRKESINTAIKNAVEILRYTLDKKIEINTCFESETIMVEGSLTQLQNVFINLGINAGHAMPDGGLLTFNTRVVEVDDNYCKKLPYDLTPGWYAEIHVTDTGTGITSEHQYKVFEPFFTTKKQSEGSGLGLASVYGTVKDHMGAIEFQSEEGQGTNFHILIPATEKKPEKNHQDVESIQYGAGSILLIEDEKIVRDTSQDILEVLGYAVLTAENGKEGVDLYKTHKETIDLVIVDMIMPKMNGKECFKEIMQIDPSAKIILASGFSKTEDIAELKDSGLLAHIKKPFQIADLSRVIKESLKI